MFDLKVPTAEEMEALRQERAADLRRRSEGDYFNPVNLGHWIALCEAAGVPFVPAEEIGRVPVEDVLRFDETPQPLTVEPFWRGVTAAMAARPRHMVRWSCCSCSDVKGRLGNGEPEFHEDFARLMIDDFRAYDLVGDFPELTIAAYARPWMDAAIHERFSVEYRVFVDHGTIMGICNYYPQRALPNDAHTLNDIGRCFAFAARLIVAQKRPMNWPPIEKHWDTKKLSCSMDFMRLETGEIVFLEGGPPYSPSGGSHPCSFAGRDPEGIAFEATPEGMESMGLPAASRTALPDLIARVERLEADVARKDEALRVIAGQAQWEIVEPKDGLCLMTLSTPAWIDGPITGKELSDWALYFQHYAGNTGQEAAHDATRQLRYIAEILALRARVASLEARLEIDHSFRLDPATNELVRHEIPPAERDSFPDGIMCRDATIELQEESNEALRARVAELEAGREWRDIATAPKGPDTGDPLEAGPDILVYGPHERRGTYVDVTHWYRTSWTIAWMDHFGQPTHWMPLPASPAPPPGGQ